MDDNQNKNLFNNDNNTEKNNTGNQPESYEYKFSQEQKSYTNQPTSYSAPQRPAPTWATPTQPPQPPQPQQQSQWAFNEYGPVGNNGANMAPKKAPKPPKKKKEKSGSGLKVFAVLISIMFVLSVTAMSGYLIYNEYYKVDAPAPTPPIADKAPTVSNTKPEVNSGDTLSAQEVFKEVSPSVVGIVTYVMSNGMQTYGQGSGVIITTDGYIVTNAHVVTSGADEPAIEKVEVVLSDGTYYPATIIGSDQKTDLAVLKIEATNLVAATLGDSDALEVGESVIVIGNPDGLQFANSMSGGMISALNREVETATTNKPVKYIQTDATINPGNSGGAMVNYHGEIVGIPVAKIVKTGFEGMGFAIPINDAKPIIDSIVANGYVTGRAKLGISYIFVPATLYEREGIPQGLRVAEVNADSDAFAKGLQKGDVITKMDGVEMVDSEALGTVLESKKPNDSIELTVFRINFQTGETSTFTMSVVLSEDKPS